MKLHEWLPCRQSIGSKSLMLAHVQPLQIPVSVPSPTWMLPRESESGGDVVVLPATAITSAKHWVIHCKLPGGSSDSVDCALHDRGEQVLTGMLSLTVYRAFVYLAAKHETGCSLFLPRNLPTQNHLCVCVRPGGGAVPETVTPTPRIRTGSHIVQVCIGLVMCLLLLKLLSKSTQSWLEVRGIRSSSRSLRILGLEDSLQCFYSGY